MHLLSKSLIDYTSAFILCVLLAPLFFLLFFLIKVDSKGPLFFTQQRVGRDEKEFKLLKFRTMTVDVNRNKKQVLPGDADITRIGRLLRRTKIDELPQLFNILGGDMSLVGPRPCLPSRLKNINDQYKNRFLVKPGLTGLAQVNGNIYLSWEDRCQYDVAYVEQISMKQDMFIILKTIAVVLLGEKTFFKDKQN